MKISIKQIFLLSLVICLPLAAKAVPLASNVLELRIENPYISPNHDGLQDNVFFTPILKSDWDVSRWRLDVVSEKGKFVYRASGAGFSTLIQWNGTDRKGQPLPEGTYRATLYAWGNGSHIQSDPQKIIVDTTPPLVELSVSSSTTYGLNFHPLVHEANPIDRWILQFIDLNGRTLQVVGSSGPVTDVLWPDPAGGAQRIAPGPYKAVFQAWDRAGNESAPVFADFTLTASGDRSVRSSLKRIHPEETTAGLLMQFSARELFSFKSGKPMLLKSALSDLDEVSLLINAYPNCAVRLDGYAFARSSAAADRDVGSLYAWTVYSYLVKQGSVQASRLTVRGRGRVPVEGREKEIVPPLKNGVEIWLLGPGPW